MKKIVFYLSILFIFTGCDYTESKTVTTNVKTADTGELNVTHLSEDTKTVLVGDKTYETSSTIGLTSDGTIEGTKSIFDFDFNTPSLTETISLAFDSATQFTVEEYNALTDKILAIADNFLNVTSEELSAIVGDTNTSI